MPSLRTEAELAALLAEPDIMAAHAPSIATRIAHGIMQSPGAVVLGDINGMMVFYPEGGGSYDAHYLFPAWTRGPDLLRRAREFLAEMFARGATVIRGETPVGNLAARRVNRSLGATADGEVLNPDSGKCIRYVLTREAFERRLPTCSSN